MNIFLRKQVVAHEDITNEGIAVYTALRYLYRHEQKEYCISENQIIFTLKNEIYTARRFQERINSGLENLLALGLIRIVGNLKATENIYDLSGLHFDSSKAIENEDYFVVITIEEIHKMMSSKKDVFNLLRCFIVTIGSLDQNAFVYDNIDGIKTPVGYMTQEYLGKQCDMLQKDYLRYAKELEDLELLFVFRHDDYYDKQGNGTVEKIRNSYGRPCDKENIVQHARDYANSLNSKRCSKKTNVKKGDKLKSWVMKYNALVYGGKEYDEDTMKEMYFNLVEFNERMEKEEMPDKLKDLTIFTKLMPDFVEFDYLDNSVVTASAFGNPN